MTDIERDTVEAEIRAKLCFTLPTHTPTTADEWCDVVDKVTKGVMEVIEKHNKEGV